MLNPAVHPSPMTKHGHSVLSAAIAALCVAIHPETSAQTIRFVRESLTFSVAADSFRFAGLYYFDNPGPDTARQQIFYPYVRGAEPPETTRIVRVSTEEAVTASNGTAGVSFALVLPPFSTEAYRFTFTQHAPGRTFEYILSTTPAWGRPLEQATFRIEVPAGLVLSSISLKPDHATRSGGTAVYSIERSGFMPDRNLSITWKRKAP